MSSSLGDIICSGFDSQLQQLMFISRSNSEYYINYSNNHDRGNVSFSAFNNIPDQNLYEYGGLCYFNPMYPSFYLNFQSRNQSISEVYQLQPYTNPPTLSKLNITLVNETLSSLAIVNDLSQTYYLAYISQNHLSRRTALHVQSLSGAPKHGTKSINRNAVLTVGGSHFQNLYYIEDDTVEIYDFDKLRFAKSMLHTHMGSSSVQVYLDYAHPNDTAVNEYIYAYSPSTSIIDIIKRNPLASSFSQTFDFATLSIANFGSSSPVQPPGQVATATSITTRAVSSTISASASASSLIRQNISTLFHDKRDVKPYSSDIEYSSDGSLNHYQIKIENEDIPRGVILVSAPNTNQNPPYNYILMNHQDGDYLFSTHEVSGEMGARKVGISPGAIAGIVIGILAFVGTLLSILFVVMKRKRRSRHIELRKEYSREMHSGYFPTVETLGHSNILFSSPYMEKGMHDSELDSPSQTSSILQESKDIPEEYYDGYRPDIRPLSYSNDHIDYAHLPSEELLQLEPDVHTSLSLFSGAYTSSAEERVAYVDEGHTTRTFFSQHSHRKCTVHYFSSRSLETFVRCVHASLRISSPYIIQSERAIVLNEPTPIFQYQYIWITSPMILEQSLHHVLLESTNWNKADRKLQDYQIWSIYNMLRSVDTCHSQNFVHLAIDLKAFYFEDAQMSSEWRLGNTDYSYSIKESGIRNIVLPHENTVFTAPELLSPQKRDEILFYHQQNVLEAIDIWALGCAIYTVASKGLYLFDDEQQIINLSRFKDDMHRHLKNSVRDNIEDHVVRDILHMFLQVDPMERKPVKQALAYWNTIYYMGPDPKSYRDSPPKQ